MTDAWGALAAPLRLIADRENRVYEMRLEGGRRAALRLHSAGYQSTEAINAELTWTEALAEAGFRCPRPLRTSKGLFLSQVEGRVASAVTWVDATPLSEMDVGPQRLNDLGRLLRLFHARSDALGLTLDRPAWDMGGLLGPNPMWGRFWENPSLSDGEASDLRTARDLAQVWLSAGTFDQGLIHADALSENVLWDGSDLWLIDFDDSGTGYRWYDLGVALVQYWERADFEDLLQALCDGYGADAEDVHRFMAVRAMVSAGWVISRAAPGDPRQRIYASRALACARRMFLD